jgi:hypothetical protein
VHLAAGNNVVFNAERSGGRKINQVIWLKFEAWKTTGLFRGELFGFPPLTLLWLLVGY